ncbi:MULTISPECIES: cysteine hydrolase family protein [unclassified Bacillus (in: firmicutes)]|uniref:cysteine hydrolase family protein n=1 Tax=unclassified Bacillus (in: firmicutes) TaxID=185979 RepID=UPI0008EB377B|nr:MULTISPECIES: cysteine hydrolase family protein [unclassified Bacillus (in: firmicutes)]SFJ49955.1 Nicotinamidase-related amidase [Bacillus sp. 71mf]SFT04461.1 Nicotinamidase-related amidase [Bacillus sp. 103mf]
MKTGLVLIDIQNDYFPGGRCELHEPLKAVENAEKVLDFFRKANLSVFHVQHISVKEGATFFLPNTEGVKIHPHVAPRKNEYVVQKNYPNSFRKTNLLQLLQREGIEHLVICGMMTHMCIDTTVRAASDLEFECTVIEDACTTKDLVFNNETIQAKHVHVAFMSALNNMFAKVIKTTEFLSNEMYIQVEKTT